MCSGFYSQTPSHLLVEFFLLSTLLQQALYQVIQFSPSLNQFNINFIWIDLIWLNWFVVSLFGKALELGYDKFKT